MGLGVTAPTAASGTIARNDHIAWTVTGNFPDVLDVYAETFDDRARPLAYLRQQLPMATEWTDVVKVKQPNGIEERRITLRKTHHGPIVAEKDGKHLAVRTAKIEEGRGILEQRYR